MITDSDNALLCACPLECEITDVIKSIGAAKSPSPDGITVLFYHTYWTSIKHEVIAWFSVFFNMGHMLRELNHTNINLIPKRDVPTMVSHYR